VTLKYTNQRAPVITGMQRVSRPGRRTYVDHDHIPRVQGGMGTAIISTSKGVMTGHDARRERVGGEVLAKVW
jgi:small subunit ribosomal protein S8